jgi:phage terminase large subunit-like protein
MGPLEQRPVIPTPASGCTMTTDVLGLRATLATATPDVIEGWLDDLTDVEADALLYDSWRDMWARPEQLWPDDEWLYWAIMTGRGWGKTRTGAEAVKEGIDRGYRRIALVGRTTPDVRDVMIEGESGILSLYAPDDPMRPVYVQSRRRIRWTLADGQTATAYTYTDKEADQLRGPQHDFAWIDELSAFQNGAETMSNLKFGLRLGQKPKAIFTFTPRPLSFVTALVDNPNTHLTRGSTYDNMANLAGPYRELVEEFRGTAVGQQELMGMLLEEAEGALWKRTWLDAKRVDYPPMDDDGVVESTNIIEAIDPAVTETEKTDEVGIVVALTAECRCNGEAQDHGFVIADRSGNLGPGAWADRVVEVRNHYGVPHVLAEGNQGGDLLRLNIQVVDPEVPVAIVHATVGKRVRAEPIVTRYTHSAQHPGLVHHVRRALVYDPERGGLVADPDRDDPDHLAALEDQLCNWEPTSGQASPGRLDAVVWALTYLMVRSRARIRPL